MVVALGQEDALNKFGDRTPLVVDLDGTLIRSDLRVQSAFAYFGQNPAGFRKLLAAVIHGKTALQSFIAATTDIDVTNLPYDDAILAQIRKAAASGRPVYLAS